MKMESRRQELKIVNYQKQVLCFCIMVTVLVAADKSPVSQGKHILSCQVLILDSAWEEQWHACTVFTSTPSSVKGGQLECICLDLKFTVSSMHTHVQLEQLPK